MTTTTCKKKEPPLGRDGSENLTCGLDYTTGKGARKPRFSSLESAFIWMIQQPLALPSLGYPQLAPAAPINWGVRPWLVAV